jgi:hypothetical protein
MILCPGICNGKQGDRKTKGFLYNGNGSFEVTGYVLPGFL